MYHHGAYIWLHLNVVWFANIWKKWIQTHLNLQKKVTDGSKLKTEQKYSAELETMLSLQHFG